MLDQEREYIEIETPVGKHKLKLKAWLTGGEKMKLSKADRNDPEVGSKAGVEMVVVGTTYEEIADYHGKDFDFVLGKLAEVAEASSLPKAETSSDSTPT